LNSHKHYSPVRFAAPWLPPAVFTSATSAENGLYMGLTEFETLAAPADWWLIEDLGPRFAIFVAPGDTWFKVRAASWCIACLAVTAPSQPHRAITGPRNRHRSQKWKWDLLHREVPGVESHWVDTQTHAFCVSEAQSGERGGQ